LDPQEDIETPASEARPARRRWRRRWLLAALVSAWAAMGFYHATKPVPPGTSVVSAPVNVAAGDIRFLYDLNVVDGRSRRIIQQQIFDTVFGVIDRARDFIVLDYFLCNDDRGLITDRGVPPYRPLSTQLADRLIARKRAVPNLKVLFITDPVNEIYGAAHASAIDRLRSIGLDVVITNLDGLRDSNAVYSGLYRLLVGWWARDGAGGGWLPNPLDEGTEPVTLGAWLTLLNFKANHRKIIAADDGSGGLVGIVGSADPHDGSSAHSNVALEIHGPLVADLLESELAVAKFSGWQPNWRPPSLYAANAGGPLSAQLLTEGAIRRALLDAIDSTLPGDSVDIAMLYLSERAIVDTLIEAARRGTAIRLILDPNRDAYGRVRDGVPNRPVATELVRQSGGTIQVRWYRTHGEQFHSKLVVVKRADRLWIMLGSANLTRRNIGDYNLEADVAVTAPLDAPVAQDALRYFDTLWRNDPLTLREYTADFPVYEDQSFGRYWRYRLMEATGLSTF
jgi:phosphatidylserine/phosphatidylglycerophosphate/cardiolipin synthase-like enzyme